MITPNYKKVFLLSTLLKHRTAYECESGAALILVIWVIALLGILVTEFAVSSRTTIKATQDYRDAAKSFYIAEAGFSRAISALLAGKLAKTKDLRNNQKNGKVNSEYIWRINSEMPAVPFGDGYYKIWIGNESGKVNLNRCSPGLVKFLFSSLGYDKESQESMSDCIADWIDSDSLYRPKGAEVDYYSTLSLPYKPKNGYMTSLDEMLFVKGMTTELYYSSFFSELATVIPWPEKKVQLPPSKADIDKTVFIKPEYDYSKININAVNPRLLSIMPGMNETISNNIEEYRKIKDITNLSEIRDIVGDSVYEGLKGVFQVEGNDYYTIDVEAWCGDFSGRQHLRAIVLYEEEYGIKKVKIINKMINPDIYRGFEYHADYATAGR